MQLLPFDLLSPILAFLARKDWLVCARVSKTFNRAATPLLYHTLDVRSIIQRFSSHPATTLVQRPDLALLVRRVTETGQFHHLISSSNTGPSSQVLHALSKCTYLTSFTWIDTFSPSNIHLLLSFLLVLKTLSIQELTIRTHGDLGSTVWEHLISFSGVQKLSIWCMSGPPSYMDSKYIFEINALKRTLTHLELGVTSFSDSCTDLICTLPLITDLRLKGAGVTALTTIVASLPNLQSLDTDYLTARCNSGGSISAPPSPAAFGATFAETQSRIYDFPVIRHLTIRPNALSLHNLWPLITNSLVPSPCGGLESFKVHGYARSHVPLIMPQNFLHEFSAKHYRTLKHFSVNDFFLTSGDVRMLCDIFPVLETFTCSLSKSEIIGGDKSSLADAIINGRNLVALHIHFDVGSFDTSGARSSIAVSDAEAILYRYKESKLRLISLGRNTYYGVWATNAENHRIFQVNIQVGEDSKWDT